jgi:PBSX family phage portal protein
MPIRKLNRRPAQVSVAKAAPRTQRAARNIRYIQVEAKGHTSDFDGIVSKAATLASQAAPDAVPYSTTESGVVGSRSYGITPSYPFQTLAKLVQTSNILRQCIEAYVVNIESYGHVLEYIGKEGDEQSPEVQAEKVRLENFLSLLSPQWSLKEVRERSRWDLETVGQRFFEISRDLAGRVVMFDHLQAVTMRRTLRDREPTEVVIEAPNPADPSTMIRKTAQRYFCRYVQFVYSNQAWERVFFKEFGDPRKIDPNTGEENPSLAFEDQATEVLMLSLYTPGQIYGLPRWIGQLPSILGSRESEMVNLNFFRENAIPAMAVLISGGALTQESFEVIDNYINALRGKQAMNRILVLEASGDDTSGSTDHSISAPRIDMKPMISERQQDGLFKEYDNANQAKVRSSFRLPPIFAGRAEDYTRASAFASIVTAEQQIFGPERQDFDDIMNNKILRTYRPRYWRFKSVGVPLADPDSLSVMLTTLDSTGALTPNAVIKIANKVLDIDIKPITEEWGDYPFAAVMQYVIAGKQVNGLTEFIVDMDAEAQKVEDDMQRQIDMQNALNPADDSTDNADTRAPAKKPKTAKPKAKSKSKSTAVTKDEEGAASGSPYFLRAMMRTELRSIAQELKHHMDANLQVPAQ